MHREKPMRPMIRIFVLAAVLASASAAFAFDRAAVNVPFSFETHGETLPAGTYDVEHDWMYHTLKLSSKTDTKMSYVWIAAPAQVSPDKSTLSLRWHPSVAQYSTCEVDHTGTGHA
jgi:hypothetical protein